MLSEILILMLNFSNNNYKTFVNENIINKT